MIRKIIAYEIKQRFWHWTTLLFFLMMVFQALWYTKGTFDQYVNEGLLMNSPAVFYKNLAGGGILMIIVVAIITGTALYKDVQYKTGQWLYTFPINEKRFYLGRFFSAFFFNVLIASGYVVGMLLTPYAGLGEAHRFGPAPIGQLLHGFFFLTVPNLFTLTSIFFFALVFTRKMAAGYLGILLMVIAFLVMQISAESGGITTILTLLDPFGYVATDQVINNAVVEERNTAYLPLVGNLFTNRILWLSIGTALFVASYFKFSFKYFGASASGSKRVLREQKNPQNPKVIARPITPRLTFTTSDFLTKLGSLAQLEFKNIVRPMSFRIILGIILLMEVLQNLFVNATYYIGPTVALTSTMTLFRVSFGVFIMILIMIWAGELFFKDRTVKIHSITDTLPVPVWVTQFARFLAMVGMAFLMALSFTLIGIGIQLFLGGASHIDLGLYIYDNMGYNWGWLSYVLWIALVFFIAGLTANRFLTHVLCVGLFFLMIMAFELGLAERTLYAYAGTPGLEDYSEVSQYGIWYTSALWYFLMWLALATAFVLLGIYFWKRGTAARWKEKLSLKGTQLAWGGKLATLLALVGFVALQSFIVQQVGLSNSFQLSAEEEQEKADYEKKYGYLEEKAQPKYTHLNLKFDYYPEERKADYEAEILLTNPHQEPIDSLFLNFESSITIGALWTKEVSLEAVQRDSVHLLNVYQLPKTLLPNDSIWITLKAQKAYHGFTQSGSEPQPDLMYNGSFGSIQDFLPIIGYHSESELDENRSRQDQGLETLDSRMAPTTDAKGLQRNIYASDAHRVTAEITLSTSEDQIPLAPGALKEQWSENGRNYRTYQVSKGTPFNWHLASGRFTENDSKVDGVAVRIMPYTEHPFNTELYEEAIHEAIRFTKRHLGGYPYPEVRLFEIPYYQEDFNTYANSIAISEKEGWYADTSHIKERAYIFQSTASQIFTQWIQENMDIADVQGGYMLATALPEALGLLLTREKLGEEALETILKKKHDFYAKEKNNEPNTEPPLRYADGIDYLEAHKGAEVLYEAITHVGTARFMSVLQHYVARHAGERLTFEGLYAAMRPSLSPEIREKIEKV
ncbi:MAG: hypothetical protein AAGA86_01020 [Bacteroidota bacterium]